MKPGELIERGIGGFQFRGEAIKLAQHPDHVPIGLLRKTALKRAVEPGQIITFDDIDILPSRALDIVMEQRKPRLVEVESKSEGWTAPASTRWGCLPWVVELDRAQQKAAAFAAAFRLCD